MSKEVFSRMLYGEQIKASEMPQDAYSDVFDAIKSGYINLQYGFEEGVFYNPKPEEKPQWEFVKDDKGKITGRRSIPDAGSQS